MSYFNRFPTILYDPAGVTNPVLVTNILKRVRLRTNMKREIVLLDKYDVQENETPEIVSDKHHGSPYYHWVVLMTNGVTDPFHDWPKSTRELQLYIAGKYGSNIDSPHHYYVNQVSGDTTQRIEVNSNYPNAITVTNYEYEVDLNETKRSIDLLRNEYLSAFLEEFDRLIL